MQRSTVSLNLSKSRVVRRLVDHIASLRWFLVVALAAAIVVGGTHPAYGESAAAAAFEAKIAKGHILVGKKKGSAQADFEDAVSTEGGHSVGSIANLDVQIVSVPPGKEKDTVTRLKGNKHVEFAEVDQQISAAATLNDPNLGSEWHIAKINAPQAWDYTLGSGVTIAILDTGVDGTHPDLAGQMVAGWNFYDNNANTVDVNGHGTAVAGAAAAASNNGIGVASVAGAARIMPVRIADPSGYAYWSTVAQGINYAADHGARVANLSYEGASASSTIQTAASYLRSKGGVLFVAAGNTGAIDNTAPQNVMMVVSATDQTDALASFSSFGSFVSISAPGNNIMTTAMGGAYQYWWGTSLATPVVAGTAALILAKRPDFTPAQVDATLKSTAVDLGPPGADIYFGAGRVNAGAAVAAAAGSTPGDTTPPTVAIVSPTGGTVAGTVTVSVNASDNVGVSRVELRVNGATVTSDASAPYTFAWNSATVANGAVTLTAVAYDAAGNSATSAAVSVNVSNGPPPDTTPPTVAIVSPTGGTVAGTVTVSVNASDNVGVSRVELRVNGVTVTSDASAPYTFAWNSATVANGTVTLTAVAYDAAGNSATSAAVSVNVSNGPPPDTTPPTVALTSPTAGATITGQVTVAATASDNVGVTRVDLKANGSTIATTNTSPYQFNWNSTLVPNGATSFTAVAFDAAGNSKTSAAVSVTINNPPPPPPSDAVPPVATITSPTGGNITGIVSVTVTATDNVGVTRVDLRVNGATVASTSTTPYRFAWDTGPLPDGTVTLTAVAYDAAGNSGASSPVSVNVAHPPVGGADTTAPTLTIINPTTGALVTGMVSIKTSASDNSGAGGIRQTLYIDGVEKATASGASLSYNWNTKKVSSGLHTIVVTATDAASNSTTRQVQVTRK